MQYDVWDVGLSIVIITLAPVLVWDWEWDADFSGLLFMSEATPGVTFCPEGQSCVPFLSTLKPG